ncbi:MAG: C4-dicarboxylate transporter DcuC [Xanthomonadales bacterium]|jgi:DcuC family C4-dicarboxylate transporter|nr:C4-dicarboxylate transporter DcuC [Xanthomonadales bacterium]
MQIIALVIIVITGFLVVKRYQTHATLFLAGFALLTTAHLARVLSGQPGLESLTGLFAFDLFAWASEAFSSRVARIGMIIMAAGGFARYMSSISASTALVDLSIGPLSRIRSPYLLLAIIYVIGQALNIFIPSAAGLAMLLLVAMYPTLVKLGVRPVAAAAVIGTTACLDLGPASPAANVAAEVTGVTPIEYFVYYQLKVAAVVVPVIAALHFFWQRWCDQREPEPVPAGAAIDGPSAADEDQARAPVVYALLPLLPLFLLFIFSPLMVQSIRLDVVTAMLISLAVGMSCEGIRHRSLREALGGIVPFFRGMGEIFSSVVTLIVAAEIFAMGIKATGMIDALVTIVERAGFGGAAMAVVMVLLLGATAMLTGSGNAALFSFSGMIPGIAERMNTQVVSLMLPSQLAGGLFRSVSPVAGVIIAVAGAAKVTPFDIIKRTSVPMIGGAVASLVASQLLL